MALEAVPLLLSNLVYEDGPVPAVIVQQGDMTIYTYKCSWLTTNEYIMNEGFHFPSF